MRARQMQVQSFEDHAIQEYLYAQQLEQQGYVFDDDAAHAGNRPAAEASAFGNWYQPN
jgi:hypothetical protein